MSTDVHDEEEDYEEEGFQVINCIEPFITESWMEPTYGAIKTLFEWNEPDIVPLRIAVCGAAGTGKKEFAKQLGKKLDLPVISGVPKMVYDQGYNINKNASFEDEFAFFISYLWSMMEYSEFISAGSLVDVIAYMHWLATKSGEQKLLKLQRSAANCVQNFAHTNYTVTIFLPFTHKPVANGLRSVDEKFHKNIDSTIRYYLDAFGIDYFPISGPTTKKLKLAMEYLDGFGLLSDR